MIMILAYAWYPLVCIGAIAAFSQMLLHGASPALAAYAPVMAAGVAVVALEQFFPERADWRPRARDVAADSAFMLVVMVALPRLLALAAIVPLARLEHAQRAVARWPHAWPLPAQVALMTLAVDFMRYWLHRACHRFMPLWRLHEVHHSPGRLYVLNVGRFHPLEKVLHFVLDSVPFLVLGVAPEVFAGYLLVYSVNGFFQHSNLRLRYGWLNYVVGSAETHRWHHARDPREAACNFGNTTIVWDLVFGTWRLPRDTPEVGIPDRAYPQGFWAQLAAPFRNSRAVSAAVNAFVGCALRFRLAGARRRIAQWMHDPMRVQYAVLDRIVRENRDTAFGREHDFELIVDYDTFAARVPVRKFEALRPYVEDEIALGVPALTAAEPACYMRTSGTTAQPKDIPMTVRHLRALRRIQRDAVGFQYRRCPEAFAGAVVALVSPPREGLLPNGKPYGAASGIVAGNTSALVRCKFAIPAQVLAIEDSLVKYLLVLRIAVARDDVTYLGAANPSTLLMLASLFREHRHALVADMRDGGFHLAARVPPAAWRVVQPMLGATPRRAAQLEALQSQARLADLFPGLRLVVTWTCASASLAAQALRQELAAHVQVMELGYLASEFRGTMTLGPPGSGLPTLDTHFFEFVERARWDAGTPEFLTLHDLVKGCEYYVIVTTPSGLYRYFINDIVKVTGFLRAMPLLLFVQKGRGVTSITGEKLYEAQVIEAVRDSLSALNASAPFAMMIADEEARVYRLYAEPAALARVDANQAATRIDRELARLNIEYAAKRESGRLEPLQVRWLAPGTGEAFKRSCVARGQREGHFKLVALEYRRNVHFDFEPHGVAT